MPSTYPASLTCLVQKRLVAYCLFFSLVVVGLSSQWPPAAWADVTQVDVCVYAATPSGINAAIAAKREGARVILVEPSRWVGGILGAGIKPRQDCPEVEMVGGLTRAAFGRLGNAPAPIRKEFFAMLKENDIPVVYEHRVASVEKDGSRIVRVFFEKAPPDEFGCPVAEAPQGPRYTIEAKVFIDASYEGDLLARAGVKYAVGRESRDTYQEKPAGVGPPTNPTPIDPFVEPGNPESGLLPLVERDHGKPMGAGDDYTQAYNFRYYVASDPKYRIAFQVPDDFDPAQYELVGRYVEYLVKQGRQSQLSGIFPGWMNSGEYNYQRGNLISIAPLGISRHYQDGDYATRARIWKQHIDYLCGLQRFLSTDPRVPADFRERIAKLGWDGRHHPDTHGCPHQLYVRVARRMLGRYMLTHEDVLNKTSVPDSVGLALYGVDTYPVRRVAVKLPKTNTWGVASEGNMFLGGGRGTGIPYPVPYRAITPKNDECTNLLVPVCFSASYIAYASARMEPVFMILGESAGVAACQALKAQQDVQDIDVARLQQRLKELGQRLSWTRKKKS